MKKRVAKKIGKRMKRALDEALIELIDGSAMIIAPARVLRAAGVRDRTYFRAVKRLG